MMGVTSDRKASHPSTSSMGKLRRETVSWLSDGESLSLVMQEYDG